MKELPLQKGLLKDFVTFCKDVVKATSSSKIAFNTLYKKYIYIALV